MISSQGWGVEDSATPQEVARCLEKIPRLLSWTQWNLPGTPPPIVSQAAYLAADQTVEDNPMSLKALIKSLGCSEPGRASLYRNCMTKAGW